jgi:hypothetical protein
MTTTDTAPPSEASTEGQQEAPEQPVQATFTATEAHLRWLLNGAVHLAGNDREIPILRSVLLRTTPRGQITATATDRYRVGILLGGGEDVTPGMHAVVPRDAVETVLSMLPDPDKEEDRRRYDQARRVRVTQDSARLTFDFKEWNGSIAWGSGGSYTTPLITAPAYPPIEKVLRDALTREPSLTAVVGINPSFFGDFAPITGATGTLDPVRVWGDDPNKSLGIAIGDYFIGALMPAVNGRYAGRERVVTPWTTYDRDAWAPILGQPDEQEGADQ